jgi:steroid 5-alpha reductase family enzyme
MSLMMTLLVIYLACAVAMTGVWLWALKIKNIGIVDVAWAALMGLAGIFCAVVGTGSSIARLAVASMAGLWAWRLFYSLYKRVSHEPEDGRYQALRAAWNGSAAKFFIFFQGQAVIVALFSLPFIAAANNSAVGFNIWLVLAILVFLVSVAGESLADKQLAAFRGNSANRGKTCRTGLWAWSRHPNYFFEWLHWFAYLFLAIGSPQFLLSLVGPVVMLAFLYRVSGIPWTEAQALRSRGDDYRRYQQEVSAFFPKPPRNSATGAV